MSVLFVDFWLMTQYVHTQFVFLPFCSSWNRFRSCKCCMCDVFLSFGFSSVVSLGEKKLKSAVSDKHIIWVSGLQQRCFMVWCCWAICTPTVPNKPPWSLLVRGGWADGASQGQGHVINPHTPRCRYSTHLIKPLTQHTTPAPHPIRFTIRNVMITPVMNHSSWLYIIWLF